MAKTGIVRDPIYIEHDPGMGHPESPERLKAIYAALDADGIGERARAVEPREATGEELELIHAADYCRLIAETDGRRVMLDPDTTTSEKSFQAAKLAAGGTIALTEAVVSGDLENGYALVRPPGHHAEHNRPAGFCLFNNIAIAAQHAHSELGVERILIADWDLHHGNGTMHSFHDRPDVTYFSTHQYPYFPGTGALEDMGRAQGEGHTINVPLVTGMGDQEYRAIFRKVLAPVAKQFAPQLILVSTGYDTYKADPLGGMRMSAEGYGTLTWELMQMARESCDGKLVLVLEGGYDLEGLSQGVLSTLHTMMDEWQPPAFDGDPGRAGQIIDAVQKVHAGKWDFSDA